MILANLVMFWVYKQVRAKNKMSRASKKLDFLSQASQNM